MVLVDREGLVVYKGHPALRNLERDIDFLLEGKGISGPGTFTSGKLALPLDNKPKNINDLFQKFQLDSA